MTYQVRLEVFAGPLDLLLHLIERAEINIYDIPIASITAQFLSHLHTLELLNLDVAGEFLVMAATLMQIKAKMLLPKPINLEAGSEGEEEEDPRRELVDRLVEYRRIKEAAGLLKEKEQEQALFFPRLGAEFAGQQAVPVASPLDGLTVWDLLEAFQTVLAAAEPDETEVPIPAEEINIWQVMTDLQTALSTAPGGALDFKALFAGKQTRRTIVTAFIALLELMRLGRVMAVQEGVFGRIVLRLGSAGEVSA